MQNIAFEQIDLNRLRLLMQVMQCGSLGAAQKKLGIPKATLSRQLNAFEKQLNLKLFSRDQNGLSLTDVGFKLIEQSGPLIKELDQIKDLVAGLNEQPQGLLKVSVPLEFGINFISPIIAKFVAQYPKIEIELDISPKRRDLIKDKYDLALRFGITDNDEQYVAKALVNMPVSLYCSPDFLLKHVLNSLKSKPTNKLNINLLNELPVICSRKNENWFFTTTKGDAKTIQVNSRFLASSSAFKRDAAIQGIGVAYLPEFICDDAVHNNQLVKMNFDIQKVSQPFYAIYQPSHYQNPKLQKLIEFLQEGLS